MGCYVWNELAPSTTIVPSLCVTSPHIELLVIKLSPSVQKRRFFLIIYRQPTGDVDIFLQVLEEKLTSDELTEHELWLIGDFNINYLKRSDSSTKKAIDFARIYGLKQLFNSVTHLTGFGCTCIDLVFTNAEFIKSSGVLNDVISDHFPIYVCVKKPRELQATSLIYGHTYVNYDETNL